MREDGELLRQVAVGREAALAEIIQRHGALVFRAARRITGDDHAADDVCQGVFLVLTRKAREMRKEGCLASWLFQTTVLVARHYQRSEQRRKSREDQAARMHAARKPASERTAALPAGLDEALARLPEIYRQAIVVRYLENRSREETATELGVTQGALDVRVTRGLEKLRSMLAHASAGVTAPVILNALLAEAQRVTPLTAAKAASLSALCSGKAAASAGATAAANAAIGSMFVAKMKIVAPLALLTLGALALAGVAYANLGAAKATVPEATVVAKAAEPVVDAAAQAPEPAVIAVDIGGCQVKAPMQLKTDPAGKKYVSTEVADDGFAQFTFSVLEDGEYYVWCQVVAKAPESDSFFVGLDGDELRVFELAGRAWSAQWQWQPLTMRKVEVPVEVENPKLLQRRFKLHRGEHVLTFRGRESGARLGSFVLTDNETFRPEGVK